MSNLVFPDLPGFSISFHRQPEWKTSVKEAWSGVETRVAQRPWPRWRFTIKADVLRASSGELKQLEAFFNKHRGSFESFLLKDPDYNAVTDQQFGTGDGTTTLFQLCRPIGDWLEPVWSPGVVAIKKSGNAQILTTDYTLGTHGQVQFNTAPAAGAALTWTGSYYMRVRFSDDKSDFERQLYGIWKNGKLELISEVFPT